MPNNTVVKTDNAPAAVGPYCQARWAGDLLYISGQIGLDPATGKMAGADVSTQAHQVMRNLSAVLTAAGLGLANLVKTTIYLTDMGDFAAVNRCYGDCFKDTEALPARATVEVGALPLGACVEIEAIAAR